MLGETNVCALCNGGGYAEYVAVPAGQVLPIPPSLHLVQPQQQQPHQSAANYSKVPVIATAALDKRLWLTAAACIPEAYFTVWHNMFQQCNIFGERYAYTSIMHSSFLALAHSWFFCMR